MKRIRGRFSCKLKSISTITSLKQSFLFQENPPDQQTIGNKITLAAIIKEDQEKELSKNQEECKKSEAKEVETEEFSRLQDFEQKCPPNGSESVVFYTTSLRGIRKTFEDCNTIRFLLESFKVLYDERDVSMHMEYREELWKIMGSRVVPPRLFIKGRYIGGADEVVSLHERGNLRKLLKGIAMKQSNSACSGCGGVRFVLCLRCNGSRKVIPDGEESEMMIRCLECNENGLVRCHICSLN